MSKSRVAPLKQTSIPRMELTAACVAVRVDQMLKRELEIPVNETYFWTDSMTVLRYICNETSRFQTFVANRLAIIHDGSSPAQWNYVDTKRNPADDCSRGLKAEELLQKEGWKNGPEFLTKSKEEWPKAVDVSISQETESLEVKKTCMVRRVDHADEVQPVDRLLKHYSEWNKLKRAVAWWLRLKAKLLQRTKKDADVQQDSSLTVHDVENAEKAIVSYIQWQNFPGEMTDGTKAKDVDQTKISRRKRSHLEKLDPEIRDGLLSVGGRLRNAKIPENAKHQIILPNSHHVSTLLIRHVHRKVGHQGHNHVLAELRQKYWIVGAGVLIKAVIRKCIVCRKYQAKTSTQKMADLPSCRIEGCEPPFTHTGMDYFGPFEIKHGRSVKKRYGVVFTCMSCRAVHIEVAGSLDTSSCINAMRRFVSRRGPVKALYSDNGTNFVGACSELKQALKEWRKEEIVHFTALHGIQWNFNPPAASHYGGVWERQIRTIRKILHAVLHEQHLKSSQSEEQLQTLMCEIEAIINSRPLTRASEDPNDLNIITPNHLLQFKTTSSPPPGRFTDKDMYSSKRWRQMQYLADIFWKRWVREYLPALQQRQKWLQPQRSLQVGDIVLIADQNAPRCSWPMARVEDVYPDSRGLVRSARLKTKMTTLTRPVTKMCLLLEAE